jgi:hypothetical protein
VSDHCRAIVPIEAWAFSSPDLGWRGISIDIGHLAESLIYYEQVYLNVSNQPQLAKLLSWFVDQGRFDTFLSLVSEGTIQFYEYSFMSAAIHDVRRNRFILRNLQDPEQQKPDSFEKRFLYHRDIEAVIADRAMRAKLYKAFRGRVIEAKADRFVASVEEVQRDIANPQRQALVVQAFVDEVYQYIGSWAAHHELSARLSTMGTGAAPLP